MDSRSIVAALVAAMACACSDGGGGEEDTAIDQPVDTTDTGADTAVDPGTDDATVEVECMANGDCVDASACTVDTCDMDYGTCVHEVTDADGDGYPAGEVGGEECGGTDCDDADEDVHPGAAPDCTGTVDANCTDVDDRDEDEDGYVTIACAGGDDCDDSDSGTFPGSLALDCSTADHDCNGEVDADNDGDGQDATACSGADCDDGDPDVRWGIAEVDCDGVDTNCDGAMSSIEDADSDDVPREACAPAGVVPDCDDADYDVYPGAPEACDAVDNDCDGSWADGGADDDGDGHLDSACGGDDCLDTDVEAHAGAEEQCTDGVDQDCDGFADCHGYKACNASGRCDIAWITILPGAFTMGSPAGEPGRGVDEAEHSVTLTGSFEIQATEVTQDQFYALLGYRPSEFSSCGGDCPVESVTWSEAAAYANAASFAAGLAACYTCTGSGVIVSCSPSATYATPYDCPGYRLPTEAEWEYAARAGTTAGTYEGTSSFVACETPNTVLDPIGWFCGDSGVSYAGCDDISGWGCCTCAGTHPVGLKTPNAWGLYDMLGNVFEWCHDVYDTYPGTAIDPWGPSSGSERVLRGGSWSNYASLIRAARRLYTDPGARDSSSGLRLSRTLP